jgi:DNA-directed RNA polymerase specialized sigma24 family protein
MRADVEREYVEFVQGQALALRRTAYRLCGDWHLAEDLVQSALILLYRHWARVASATAPEAYVRKVLVNAVLDDRRHWWARSARCSAGAHRRSC